MSTETSPEGAPTPAPGQDARESAGGQEPAGEAAAPESGEPSASAPAPVEGEPALEPEEEPALEPEGDPALEPEGDPAEPAGVVPEAIGLRGDELARAAKAATNELTRELARLAPRATRLAAGVAQKLALHVRAALHEPEPVRGRCLAMVAALGRLEVEAARVRGVRLAGAKLEEAIFGALLRGIARVLPVVLALVLLVGCVGPTPIDAAAIEPAVANMTTMLERYIEADRAAPAEAQVATETERALATDMIATLRTLIAEATAQ